MEIPIHSKARNNAVKVVNTQKVLNFLSKSIIGIIKSVLKKKLIIIMMPLTFFIDKM